MEAHASPAFSKHPAPPKTPATEPPKQRRSHFHATTHTPPTPPHLTHTQTHTLKPHPHPFTHLCPVICAHHPKLTTACQSPSGRPRRLLRLDCCAAAAAAADAEGTCEPDVQVPLASEPAFENPICGHQAPAAQQGRWRGAGGRWDAAGETSKAAVRMAMRCQPGCFLQPQNVPDHPCAPLAAHAPRSQLTLWPGAARRASGHGPRSPPRPSPPLLAAAERVPQTQSPLPRSGTASLG